MLKRLRLLSANSPRWLTPALCLFLLAFFVRLWVLLRITDAPGFIPDNGDMKFYNDWARRIAAGTWTDHKAFYGMPLYAYWLAGIYTVFGFQPYLALLVQVAAEAATTVIIFKSALLAFPSTSGNSGKAIGIPAALGWVFFVPAQTYSAILMPTTYLVLAFWFVIWQILRRRGERLHFGEAACLGLLMGFVAMMIATILFLVPLVIAAFFLARSWPGNWRRALAARAAAAALLLACVYVGAAPCWIHNYFIAREPVLLSAHSGLNFWIGNYPGANGYPKIPAGLRADQEGLLLDSITCAEKATGHPMRRCDVSNYWAAKANDYIHHHPLEWCGLLAVKLRNFWSSFQYDDLSIITHLREDGITLPGPGFGLVAALGLPGLLLAVFRRPGARWIAAGVLLHMASLMTVFVTERYRMAAVPGLLLLGAYGVNELFQALQRRQMIPCAAYIAPLVAACTFVYWPQGDPALATLDDYNTGVADIENQRYDRAQAKLERIYAIVPRVAELNFALGNLWLAKGDRDRAKLFYRRTLELDPQHSRVLNNLGVLALEEHRWQLAEQFLARALEINPGDAKGEFLYAKACWGQGHAGVALAAVARALQLQPGRADFLQLQDEIKRAQPQSL